MERLGPEERAFYTARLKPTLERQALERARQAARKLNEEDPSTPEESTVTDGDIEADLEERSPETDPAPPSTSPARSSDSLDALIEELVDEETHAEGDAPTRTDLLTVPPTSSASSAKPAHQDDDL